MMQTALGTADLIGLLRGRYAEPEWVLLEQVREGTGFGDMRTADAVAMNLWPSRGLALHGFELKVSRSDWLRELKNPGKAEPMARLTDAWWVVAPVGVVHDDELPAGWGLLVPGGSGLRAHRAAVVSVGQAALSRAFVAALIRRAQGVVTDNTKLRSEYTRGFESGTEASRNADARAVAEADRRARECRDAIDAFERASGIRIFNWNAGHLGDAVRAVLAGEDRVRAVNRELERLHDQARRLADGIARELSVQTQPEGS